MLIFQWDTSVVKAEFMRYKQVGKLTMRCILTERIYVASLQRYWR